MAQDFLDGLDLSEFDAQDKNNTPAVATSHKDFLNGLDLSEFDNPNSVEKPMAVPQRNNLGNKALSFGAGTVQNSIPSMNNILSGASQNPFLALLGKGGNDLAGLAGYGISPQQLSQMNAQTDIGSHLKNLDAVKQNPWSNIAGQITGGIAVDNPLATSLGVGRAATGLGRIAQQGLFGGGAEALQSHGDPKKMLEAGALSMVPAAGIEGINAGVRKAVGKIPAGIMQEVNNAMDRLGVSKYFRSPHKTGDLKGQQYVENTLLNSPWTSTLKDYKKGFDSIDEEARTIPKMFKLEDEKGNPIEHEIDEQGLKKNIVDKINDTHQKNLESSKKEFNDLSTLADKRGIVVPRNNYHTYLEKIVSDYENPHNVYHNTQPHKEAYDYAKRALDAGEKIGVRENPPKFSETQEILPKLNDAMMQNYSKPELRNFYAGLKHSLRADMTDAVKNSNNKILMEGLETANQNWAQKVAPVKKELVDFIKSKFNETPNPDDILKKLVHTGSGNPTDLDKFLKIFPNIKDDLGYLNLTKSKVKDTAKSPLQMMKANMDNLSNPVAETLYSPEVMQKVNDLNLVNKHLQSARSNIANPNNGQKNSKFIPSFLNKLTTGGSIGLSGYLHSPYPLAAYGLAHAYGIGSKALKDSLMKKDPRFLNGLDPRVANYLTSALSSLVAK